MDYYETMEIYYALKDNCMEKFEELLKQYISKQTFIKKHFPENSKLDSTTALTNYMDKAIYDTNIHAIKLLLKYGADINAEHSYEKMDKPLYLATLYLRIPVLIFLLKQKECNVNICISNGDTVLIHLMKQINFKLKFNEPIAIKTKMVKLLIEHPSIDLTVKNNKLKTFWDYVAQIKNRYIVLPKLKTLLTMDRKRFTKKANSVRVLYLTILNILRSKETLIKLCSQYINDNRKLFKKEYLNGLPKDIRKLLNL